MSVNLETDFQKKALRPGGMTREAAIHKAQAGLQAMRPGMDTFIDENLAALAQASADMRSHQSPDWDSLYNPASQIRDIGSTAGFELLTLVAANLCDILDELKSGAGEKAGVIDCHVTALMAFRRECYRDVSATDTPELAAGFNALLRMTKSSAHRNDQEPA